MLFATATQPAPAPEMTPIATFLGAEDPSNFLFAYIILYLIINALSILVFNLGFARRLPILQTVIVYVLMFFGNIFITLFALTLPIIESLFIAALILGIYKFQLRRHKKELAEEE
ncbi:YlaH-like family protein [Paenalkalicoccus suaedae]|uniref:YlaH-like family protein n=1 Tax=Paenalkalicoccus suaedae TaxID=2592382 RepID=A0A859FDW8_9BACI|nr:YlaH-like family protein [Paenalkalicoccus suaedae]QKS71563.1 YlaH-like family protein [Paenalkalicoccus suaedae]